MDNKTIGVIVIVAAVVGGASFWGGMTYAQSQRGAGRGAQNGIFSGRPGAATGNRFAGGGAAFGTILSKDATSITVQLVGGPNASSTTQGTGSKIVLYDTGTQIGKFTTGTPGDLTVGENVMVAGTANSDGSITAQSIQIRPAGAGGFRGAGQ